MLCICASVRSCGPHMATQTDSLRHSLAARTIDKLLSAMQIGYQVLSHEHSRALYDNLGRAAPFQPFDPGVDEDFIDPFVLFDEVAAPAGAVQLHCTS